MAFEYGVVLAALMGAAAALMGGVLAQRYQYLLEKQKDHFLVLRDNVLVPWNRAIGARLNNLAGRDPYVVVDYVAKDYRSSPGVAVSAAGEIPWTETSGLAAASRKHWPRLWSEWEALNKEHLALGDRVVAQLRKLEGEFPPLPPGKVWANYPDDPRTAIRIAVVNAWASQAQLFERRTYPDWVVSQLTQFGFWRTPGEEDQKHAYAKQVVGLFDRHQGDVARLEGDAEALAQRYEAFARKVEDAVQTETLRGHCDYCPRFLR